MSDRILIAALITIAATGLVAYLGGEAAEHLVSPLVDVLDGATARLR